MCVKEGLCNVPRAVVVRSYGLPMNIIEVPDSSVIYMRANHVFIFSSSQGRGDFALEEGSCY